MPPLPALLIERICNSILTRGPLDEAGAGDWDLCEEQCDDRPGLEPDPVAACGARGAFRWRTY